MKDYTVKELLKMSVTERRKILREVNKVARVKAKRLKKAGYTGAMANPQLLNASKVPSIELVRRIEEVQIYNRSPLSTVKGMKKFEKDTLETLKSHGYGFVDKSNLADFGRYMNMVRSKHLSKMFPSDEVAKMFVSMEKLGISPRVIETKFKGWLASQEGIVDLKLTLDEMELEEGRVRASSTEVANKMIELGLLDKEEALDLGFNIKDK